MLCKDSSFALYTESRGVKKVKNSLEKGGINIILVWCKFY